ncbi:MAG: permease-like cell division protein FtsX [Solirubrobacteraceae bacterium]
MRFTFFLREAMRSLTRNAMPSFAAMATILVTILVLGVFIPVVQATNGAANEVRGKLLLDVYLKSDAKPGDAQRVKKLILATPNVKSVQYVSKEQAYAEQRKKNPDAYELLGKVNPLPDTFRVTPSDPSTIDQIRDRLAPVAPAGGRAPADKSIDEVKNRREETDKILSATRVVKLSVGALALLLGVASMLLIANTIRLSLFARRREVEVMKLVGATDWFIRWPFVIEGVIVGFAGAVLAILFLAVGKVAFIDPLAQDFKLIAAPDTLNFGLLIAILLGAAVAVSAAGSGLSLRRFLRV